MQLMAGYSTHGVITLTKSSCTTHWCWAWPRETQQDDQRQAVPGALTAVPCTIIQRATNGPSGVWDRSVIEAGRGEQLGIDS